MSDAKTTPGHDAGQRFVHATAWLLCGLLTGLLVFAGVQLGGCFLDTDDRAGFVESMARFDGRNHKEIVEIGYSYDASTRSKLAFFPAFPLSARALSRATGLGTVPSLLIVSNMCLLAAFFAMGAYLRLRLTEHASLADARSVLGTPRRSRDVANYALLGMALCPTTFFFRMAYSEAMFLLVSIVAMYTMARGRPLVVVASIVGLATAVRPVGVALLLPLAWYAAAGARSNRHLFTRLGFSLSLGSWGLLSYMAFQWWQFGEPFAFALTQEHWSMRPLGSAGDKLVALGSWEPIWATYVPGFPEYWRRFGNAPSALLSLQFANPIYFVGTGALVTVGACKRWLTVYEVLLCVPLLGIPYVTRAYEMCMNSQARFAAVVFPAYLVMGHLLARMPNTVSVALLALSGFLMGAYAALFATGHLFF